MFTHLFAGIFSMALPDVNYGFRKFTRAWLAYGGTPEVPIPTLANPASVELNPGIELGEIDTTACTGETTTAFTYAEAIKGQIKMSFPATCPELDSLILFRRFATQNSVSGFVLLEATLTPGVTTVAAKASGQYGYEIVSQSAATTTATAYYLDPVTKLKQSLEIVDASPTGNQIMIGNAGLLTVSTALAAAERNIYVNCPCTFASGTVMTSTAVQTVVAYLVGIHFDQTVKLIRAANCTIEPGATFNNEPTREITLRILRDPSDGTGLGFSMKNINATIAC